MLIKFFHYLNFFKYLTKTLALNYFYHEGSIFTLLAAIEDASKDTATDYIENLVSVTSITLYRYLIHLVVLLFIYNIILNKTSRFIPKFIQK
jgi:hypothetical protein